MSTEQQELDLVEALAVRMRTKLRENAHKVHWGPLAIPDLLKWLKDEVTELEEALANEGPEAIAYEAADVANFAAMIAAKALSLPPRTEIRPPYVRLGNTAMRRKRDGYYRDFGEWGVKDGFIDGRHVAIVNPAHPDIGRFHGMPLVPISREEYLRNGAEDVSAFNSGNPFSSGGDYCEDNPKLVLDRHHGMVPNKNYRPTTDEQNDPALADDSG